MYFVSCFQKFVIKYKYLLIFLSAFILFDLLLAPIYGSISLDFTIFSFEYTFLSIPLNSIYYSYYSSFYKYLIPVGILVVLLIAIILIAFFITLITKHKKWISLISLPFIFMLISAITLIVVMNKNYDSDVFVLDYGFYLILFSTIISVVSSILTLIRVPKEVAQPAYINRFLCKIETSFSQTKSFIVYYLYHFQKFIMKFKYLFLFIAIGVLIGLIFVPILSHLQHSDIVMSKSIVLEHILLDWNNSPFIFNYLLNAFITLIPIIAIVVFSLISIFVRNKKGLALISIPFVIFLNECIRLYTINNIESPKYQYEFGFYLILFSTIIAVFFSIITLIPGPSTEPNKPVRKPTKSERIAKLEKRILEIENKIKF